VTEGRTRRLAAVWFADIVGYTALSTRDEDAAMEVVDEFQRLSREAVGDKGRVVKFLGDGAMSVFDSTNRALESALTLRDAFVASEIARRHGCTLSVGVHMGEVIQAEDGDVYGDGVNVAARIEGVATTNQVVVSEDVYRLIRNRSTYNPQSIGEHTLKGVEKPATLYVLARPGETVPTPRAMAAVVAPVGADSRTASDRSHRKAVAVGTVAGITGFVLLSVFVAWSTNVVELGGEDAGQATAAGDAPAVVESAPPTVTEAPATSASPTDGGVVVSTEPDAATDTPDPVRAPTREAAEPAPSADATQPQPPADARPGNQLLVLVFGEGPAGTAETQILRSLGNVTGVSAVDASGAALLRRNPEVARGALQGDIAALSEMARRQGIEYIVLGDFESSATQVRGRMFSGSAQLGLRMYRVSTGELIDSGMFGVGTGSGPAIAGGNELGVRTQAAQAVGREGAVAARRWLLSALRN
jgi:class 3 adenylate cyclase